MASSSWLAGGARLLIRSLALSLASNGVLRQNGWARSVRELRPVDNQGQPLPWYSYAAIDFLEPRLESNFRAFDYGAGYSCLWYATRLLEVEAVTDSAAWQQEILAKGDVNLTIHLATEQERYVKSCGGKLPFQLINLGGHWRHDAARYAPQMLSGDGVLIWDDSDKMRDGAVQLELRQLGFRQLDFSGMGPISNRSWTTSIFYRRSNCLDI